MCIVYHFARWQSKRPRAALPSRHVADVAKPRLSELEGWNGGRLEGWCSGSDATFYAVRSMRAVMTVLEPQALRDLFVLGLWIAASYACGYVRLRYKFFRRERINCVQYCMRPWLCMYYVTLRCTARCAMCDVWRGADAPGYREQTLAEVQENLRALPRLGVRLLDFTGGEPLLFAHILDALRCARQMGMRTTLTTNCTHYPDLAEQLCGLVQHLQFSCEAADAATHDAVRGPGSHARVLESMACARRLGQRFNLVATITDVTLAQLDTLLAFAAAHRTVLALNPCFASAHQAGLSAAGARVLMRAARHPWAVADHAALALIADGGNQCVRPVCRAGRATMTITPDNQVAAPCLHHEQQRVPIAGDLAHAWRATQAVAARAGTYEVCRGCTLYCYMRASLYRRYPLRTLRSLTKYCMTRLRRGSA